MNSIIRLRESNCKDCYKCIRHCPVKAISFAENQAQIIPQECILCGMCFVVCPQNAKEIRPDVDRVRAAMAAGRRVVASIAPSFIADFDVGGIEDMREALVALGFADAEETAIGAGIVSRAYENLMREGTMPVIITSCCHAINLLIQKYHPDMLPYLAPVLSPMQAHCKLIKENDSDAYTVFIGPCIAKKDESDRSQYTDAALTFDELRDWLGKAGVAITRRQRTPEDGKRARFYPATGGILKSLDAQNGYRLIAIDGAQNCIQTFSELKDGRLKRVFIEMSACEGSCVNGPYIREHHMNRLTGALRVGEYAGTTDFATEKSDGIHHTFNFEGTHRVQPGGEAVEKVLEQMGKTHPEKQLNCGSCGYPTCRDKAIAVCQGKAEIGMCLPFLKERAESFSDTVIGNTPNAVFVLDENLVVQQVNRAALALFHLRAPDEILHAPIVTLLNPIDYMNVMISGKDIINKCIYVAEFKIYVEETIVYDRQNRVLVCILRDVTERECIRENERVMRRRTIEITDKVIDKQMRAVQEIASLLGETTAETKTALTRLKDAMQHE